MATRMVGIGHLLGIHMDIPEEEYHASPGLSQSQLKLIGEEGGPAKFRYGLRRETKSQKLGTLVHSMLLQPHLVPLRYHVTDLLREGTKGWLEEADQEPEKIMVKRADYDKARSIVDAVFRWSPVARELLISPDRMSVENSFYWIDEESGLLCRGRADAVHHDFQVIVDLKTAESASRDGFQRAVRDYGYHIQNAHYVDGWPAAGSWTPQAMLFIVVEKQSPWLTATYELRKGRVQEGREEIRRLIEIYQECSETNEWPGYPEGVQEL